MKNEIKKPEVTTRKLTDLRACDCCGGKVAPVFYTVQVRMAVIHPEEANSTLGMVQMLGGFNNRGSLAVAEALSPSPEPVKIMKEPLGEIFLCMKCYTTPVCAAELLERQASKEAKEKDED